MTPLAVKLRPSSLDDIVGQQHILYPNSPLRKMIEHDMLNSIIFYGPPGTGKTTLAKVIANTTNFDFHQLNATSASVSAIRKIGNEASKNNVKSILFVDEIHRFSKTQQDVLLPFMEKGIICLIGATTENPFHSINPALLSRSQIFRFEPLNEDDLMRVLFKSIKYYRSTGKQLKIQPDAAKHIIKIACGDARKVISTLEIVVSCLSGNEITLPLVEEVSPSKYMVFGKDDHFDLASAFQGSIQASDADATVFWLAKWLESGEDPRYIARRLLVSASEDAASNPQCVCVAHAAYTAACEIGRPECDILLAQAAIMIAESPRNKRAAKAIWAAVSDVRKNIEEWVPKEMKDCHYNGAKQLGNGSYHDGSNQNNYVGIKTKYLK